MSLNFACRLCLSCRSTWKALMVFRVLSTWVLVVCSKDKLCMGMIPLLKTEEPKVARVWVFVPHGAVDLASKDLGRQSLQKVGRRRRPQELTPIFPYSTLKTLKKVLKVCSSLRNCWLMFILLREDISCNSSDTEGRVRKDHISRVTTTMSSFNQSLILWVLCMQAWMRKSHLWCLLRTLRNGSASRRCLLHPLCLKMEAYHIRRVPAPSSRKPFMLLVAVMKTRQTGERR